MSRAARAVWRSLPAGVADPLRRVRRLVALGIAGGELGQVRADGTRALEHRTAELLGRQDAVLASYERRVAALTNRVLDLEERQGPSPADRAVDDANLVLATHARSRLPGLDLRRAPPPPGGDADDGSGDAGGTPDAALVALADVISGHPLVVDIAAGDGRLLRLLRDRGVAACGVEADPAAAARLRGDGLDVAAGDLFVALAATDDASVGAVVARGVVEHLDVADVGRLLVAARRALRPGGLVVVESTYPESAPSLVGFWRDPWRLRPYDPTAVAALAACAGLTVVETIRQEPGGEDYRLVCSA
ncbi:MAG: methyltransferase domain-containing protein [Acidimicrobiales bacterium]